jgi:hypothetical protein
MKPDDRIFKLEIRRYDYPEGEKLTSTVMARLLRNVADTIEGKPDERLWAYTGIRDSNELPVGEYALKEREYWER